LDGSIGKEVLTCIISLRTTRKTFEAIDLKNVDYKACLDGLGAVYKKKVINLVPIEPLLDVDNYENNFIEVDEEQLITYI
jgi:restriction system protein